MDMLESAWRYRYSLRFGGYHGQVKRAMAAVTCKYHTQTPARWRCDNCQINFCPNCVKSVGNRPPDCPVCKRELTSLGSANLIKPFWARLRHFFLYPLHPGPLIVMSLLSVVALLLAQLPGWNARVEVFIFQIPRNLLFALPFVFVFFKYAQSVLEETAHGYLKPKPLSAEQLTENGLIVFKLLFLLIVFNLIQFSILLLFGRVMSYIAGIVLGFAMPAAIMILAMEDKLLSALNPEVIGSVILRIGAPYFLLFVLFYLLHGARDTMLGLLAGMVNPTMGVTIFVFVSMYFYLIMFNMMGYLLFQRHEELGFDLDVDVETIADKPKQTQESQVSPELRAVEILIHEGKSEEAVKQLEAIIRNSPTEIEAHERLLRLLRLTGNTTLHREHGQAYISYLMRENKFTQAAKVYQACNEFDKNFKPANPGERLELAKVLRHNGQAKLAMALLNNLHKDFPNFENVPEAYLMVAQILCEQFNEDARASQVLGFIIKNYPSHPMLDAVRDYQRIVDDVSSH